MSKQRLKITSGFFTSEEEVVLETTMTWFSEVEGDCTVGELRDYTSKRSALPVELVDRVNRVMEVDAFRYDYLRVVRSAGGSLLVDRAVYVCPDSIMVPLAMYFDVLVVMLDDSVASRDHPGIQNAAGDMATLSRITEKLEATIATLQSKSHEVPTIGDLIRQEMARPENQR